MQTSVQETFKELLEIQENSACFECGVTSCYWVSVNNGIFLCLSCSNQHRGFGPSLSLIRSIALDSWSDDQLALMRNGGNAALWACFNNYDIPHDKPIDYKYRTKAGVYYREMLKAISQDQPVPEPPAKEEGAELSPLYSKGAASPNDKGKKEANIFEKITVQSMAQGAAEFGTSMSTGTKTFVNKINSPNLKNDMVEFGANLGEKTSQAVEETIGKTKEAWANREQLMSKASDAAVKGWDSTVKSTVSFWKKITGKKEESKDSAVENIVIENTAPETISETVPEAAPETVVENPIGENVVENTIGEPVEEKPKEGEGEGQNNNQ